MEEEMIIKEIEKAVPAFVRMSRNMWIDYDQEADVLYISFEKPQNAEDSEMEDDIIIHRRDSKMVGLTVLHASKHMDAHTV